MTNSVYYMRPRGSLVVWRVQKGKAIGVRQTEQALGPAQ